MSRATSFASVVQQMSGAVGVAVAAASVESIRFGAGRRAAISLIARHEPQLRRRSALISARVRMAVFARPEAPEDAAPKVVGHDARRSRGERAGRSDKRKSRRAARPIPRSAAEPRRQHIELRAVGPARFRLQMAHGGKIALQTRQQFALRAAVQHLGEEEAARRQHAGGEIGGEFGEADDAQMVGLAVAGRVGGHVGHHAVGGAAEPSRNVSGAAGSWKSITLNSTPSIGSISRRSMPITRPLPSADLTARRRDLAPAAGRGAEIDDARAGPEQLIFLGDLHQLVGGARAKSLAPGLGDEGVVELALEPQRRRQASACARSSLASSAPGRPRGPIRPPAIVRRPSARACGPTPIGAHHLRQNALAQSAVGDADPLGGKMRADRLENRAAGQHEIGALGADAGVGGAFGVAHRAQARDRRVDLGAATATGRRPRAGRSEAD